MFVVLIDTSAYEEHQLSFQGPIFDSLTRLAYETKISLIGSEIILREMESHISEEVKKSVNQIIKTSGNIGHVTKDDLGELTRLLSNSDTLKKRIIHERIERMKTFFANNISGQLDHSKAYIPAIFEDYFNQEPPFGEGKKKAEFPDAFVLNAFLEQYKIDSPIYVVSNDKDWEKFSNKHSEVQLFKKISEFIDFVHENYDQVVTERLKLILEKQETIIVQAIRDEILESEFEVSDWWINPEVEAQTNSLDVRVSDYNIIDITPEIAQLEVTAEIYLRLVLSASDEEASYKDPDTKENIYLGNNKYLVEKTEFVDLSLVVAFELDSTFGSDYIKVHVVALPDTFYYLDEEETHFEIIEHWNE